MGYFRLSNIGTDIHNYSDSWLIVNKYKVLTMLENDYFYYTPMYGGIEVKAIN